MKIIKHTSVNFADILLTKLDRKNGLVYIRYNNGNKSIPLIIETDYMLMNFDATYEDSNRTSYGLLLSIIGESEESTNGLRTFFNDLEGKIMQEIKTNMTNWFNVSPDEKVRYKMLIKDIDDRKDGILKVKLRRSKSFRSLIFNDRLEEVPKGKIDDILVSGNYVKIIFELPYVRFKNGTFSIHLKVHQIKISDKFMNIEDGTMDVTELMTDDVY
jgi:hypothetical protein